MAHPKPSLGMPAELVSAAVAGAFGNGMRSVWIGIMIELVVIKKEE